MTTKTIMGTSCLLLLCVSCWAGGFNDVGCLTDSCVADPTEKLEKLIREQASFDFQCDADKLTLTKMGDLKVHKDVLQFGVHKYGVRGCGKQAPYNGGCTAMGNCNIGRGGDVQKSN